MIADIVVAHVCIRDLVTFEVPPSFIHSIAREREGMWTLSVLLWDRSRSRAIYDITYIIPLYSFSYTNTIVH